MNLKAVELRTMIPAKDFNTSLRFYEAIGFEKKYQDDQIAYLVYGGQWPFLLQNFYQKELAENLVQHLLVENVADWHQHLEGLQLAAQFDICITAITEKPWKMKEFHLIDPSGVLWTIAQNT